MAMRIASVPEEELTDIRRCVSKRPQFFLSSCSSVPVFSVTIYTSQICCIPYFRSRMHTSSIEPQLSVFEEHWSSMRVELRQPNLYCSEQHRSPYIIKFVQPAKSTGAQHDPVAKSVHGLRGTCKLSVPPTSVGAQPLHSRKSRLSSRSNPWALREVLPECGSCSFANAVPHRDRVSHCDATVHLATCISIQLLQGLRRGVALLESCKVHILGLWMLATSALAAANG